MTTYLPELLVTLFGTFAGVFFAFWLDRRQQEAHAKNNYASTLNSVRADLANLGAICRKVSEHLGRNEVRLTLTPIEAPALDAALTNPSFYDRAPYGLLTCLIVTATSRRAIQSMFAQTQPMSPSELKPIVEELLHTLAYVGTILDDEIKLFDKPIIRTLHDVRIIDGLKAARRGENVQMNTDRTTRAANP
jgi:hypothetical protein